VKGGKREVVWLHTGTQFYIRVEEDTIILEPIKTSAIEALYGKYPDADFLSELEAEHRQRP